MLFKLKPSELDREFGVSRGKLLHLEWISNEVLVYSTGNSAQYPIITYNGKESEEIYIYTLLYI